VNAWNTRPVEIRNLFNPAFCAVVLCRSLISYEESNPDGMPFSLSLLVLPLCLHKLSREILYENKRSYLIKIVEQNQQILVGLPERATSMLPFTLEGLGCALQYGCIKVTSDGRFKSGANSIRKAIKGSDESVMIERVAKSIGEKFAITDRLTIYTTLGIKP
jgi:hypothetical protein